MPETAAGSRSGALARWSRLVARHWLLTLLLLAGLVLRILVEIAYRPALFYIDTLKYLFGAYPGNDPPGYQLVLKPFLDVFNLDAVAAVQHLLGLGMAVALYVLLLRRGSPRWIAALATAPVLLDAYQLQIEATIMPDVLFEALMVAGVVVLLWRPRPIVWHLVIGGILLGATATMWEPGEILVLPAVIYAFIMARGWRRSLIDAGVTAVAFALPILLVCYRDKVDEHHFSLAPQAGNTIYGRMAWAADCATLKLPSYEKPLCPSQALKDKLGIDGLDHSADSPLRHLTLPAGMSQHSVASDFTKRVVEQQPLRVTSSILGNAVELFEVNRVSGFGNTPISRWQFQNNFPQFLPYERIVDGDMQFNSLTKSGAKVYHGDGRKFGGGRPRTIPVLDRFLRSYQLNGGYTPGPGLLFMLIAGIVGSAFLLLRRKRLPEATWDAARTCFYFLASGVLILLLSDSFEFSWRYQLPALLTLPPAAALAITVIISWFRDRRQVPAVATAGPAAEAQATEAQATGVPVATAPAPATATAPAESGPAATENGARAVDTSTDASTEPAAAKDIEDREPQGKNHASAG